MGQQRRHLGACLGVGLFLAPIQTTTTAECRAIETPCERSLFVGLTKANGTAARRLLKLDVCRTKLADSQALAELPPAEIVELTETGTPGWVWPTVAGVALVSVVSGLLVGLAVKR